MNARPCSGCGLWTCDGIACYLADPVTNEPEAITPREPYTPSAEYLAWCAEIDSKRTTVTHGDPLLGRAA